MVSVLSGELSFFAFGTFHSRNIEKLIWLFGNSNSLLLKNFPWSVFSSKSASWNFDQWELFASPGFCSRTISITEFSKNFNLSSSEYFWRRLLFTSFPSNSDFNAFQWKVFPCAKYFNSYVLLSTYIHLYTGLNDHEHPRVVPNTVVVDMILQKINRWIQVKENQMAVFLSSFMFRQCLRSAASPLCYTSELAQLVLYGRCIWFCLFSTRVQRAQINRRTFDWSIVHVTSLLGWKLFTCVLRIVYGIWEALQFAIWPYIRKINRFYDIWLNLCMGPQKWNVSFQLLFHRCYQGKIK